MNYLKNSGTYSSATLWTAYPVILESLTPLRKELTQSRIYKIDTRGIHGKQVVIRT